MTCTTCGAQLAPNLLVCPSCRALVHAHELKQLAVEAESAAAAADYTTALQRWRRALELLPAGSTQHAAVLQKIATLGKALEAQPSVAKTSVQKPKWANAGGALGALGLLVWKFKFALVFLLTKGKLLLLGLTKGGTLISMLLSIGVYATIWGWQFALGFVLCIYVHEMGHVYRLSRYGIRATAPMFIPGLGAMIRLKQYPATPHEEATTGLAGPVWGLGAAIACYLIHLGTNSEIFAALARSAAWINLFNLLPVWQLDGGHAFKALTRAQRGIIAAVMLAMFFLTKEGLLAILTIVAAARAFQKDAAATRDTPILLEFAFLVITLSLLSQIAVQLPH